MFMQIGNGVFLLWQGFSFTPNCTDLNFLIKVLLERKSFTLHLLKCETHDENSCWMRTSWNYWTVHWVFTVGRFSYRCLEERQRNSQASAIDRCACDVRHNDGVLLCRVGDSLPFKGLGVIHRTGQGGGYNWHWYLSSKWQFTFHTWENQLVMWEKTLFPVQSILKESIAIAVGVSDSVGRTAGYRRTTLGE